MVEGAIDQGIEHGGLGKTKPLMHYTLRPETMSQGKDMRRFIPDLGSFNGFLNYVLRGSLSGRLMARLLIGVTVIAPSERVWGLLWELLRVPLEVRIRIGIGIVVTLCCGKVSKLCDRLRKMSK